MWLKGNSQFDLPALEDQWFILKIPQVYIFCLYGLWLYSNAIMTFFLINNVQQQLKQNIRIYL